MFSKVSEFDSFSSFYSKTQLEFSAAIQVSVNPKIEFVDEEPGEKVAPKIQGVRVIVDAVKSSGGESFSLSLFFELN